MVPESFWDSKKKNRRKEKRKEERRKKVVERNGRKGKKKDRKREERRRGNFEGKFYFSIFYFAVFSIYSQNDFSIFSMVPEGKYFSTSFKCSDVLLHLNHFAQETIALIA